MIEPDELPCDHHSRFPAEWWNERRKRDYYIDANGLVRLDPDSPTGQELQVALVARAREFYLSIVPPAGSA